MAFPSNPTNGDQATRFNRVYEFNSDTQRWTGLYSVPLAVSPIPTSGSGGQTALLSSTGGTIVTTDLFLNDTNDDFYQYRYHIFTSSSSFVSSGVGTVDILLVGGGGGGGGAENGGYSGNGGNGGGVTTVLSRNVAAQSYTVTVGTGGTGGSTGGTRAGGAGGSSSVAGITGASAGGGAGGLNNSGFWAGSGAGGPRTGTATATTAYTAGPGIATDFFQYLDISSVADIQHLRTEMLNDNIYFGGGGVSGRYESTSAALYRGEVLLGGGGGCLSATYFANMGWTTGSNTSQFRQPLPSSGGGGLAGIRASTSYSAGGDGATGLVAIRYKI